MCVSRFVLNQQQRYLNGLMQDLADNNQWVPLFGIPVEIPAPPNNNVDTTIVDIGPNEEDEDSDIDSQSDNIRVKALIVFFALMMGLLATFNSYFIHIKLFLFSVTRHPLKYLFLGFVLGLLMYKKQVTLSNVLYGFIFAILTATAIIWCFLIRDRNHID